MTQWMTSSHISSLAAADLNIIVDYLQPSARPCVACRAIISLSHHEHGTKDTTTAVRNMNLARRRQKQKVKQVERMTTTLPPPPTTMASNSNGSNTYSPMPSMSLWTQICASLYVLSGVTQVWIHVNYVHCRIRVEAHTLIDPHQFTHGIVLSRHLFTAFITFILHAPINHCHRLPRKKINEQTINTNNPSLLDPQQLQTNKPANINGIRSARWPGQSVLSTIHVILLYRPSVGGVYITLWRSKWWWLWWWEKSSSW